MSSNKPNVALFQFFPQMSGLDALLGTTAGVQLKETLCHAAGHRTRSGEYKPRRMHFSHHPQSHIKHGLATEQPSMAEKWEHSERK